MIGRCRIFMDVLYCFIAIVGFSLGPTWDSVQQ